MQKGTDLKQIQRRVYMSYFQDGLWDILLGVFLVGWGVMIMFEFVAVMGGIWVAFFFIVLGLKRWLIYPRAGYIKIAEARRQQMKMVIMGVVLLLLGLAVSFLFDVGSQPAWIGEYFMFLFGAMMAIIIFVLGYWWKVDRWYVYAGLVLAAFAAHQWLYAPLNLSFIVPGVVVILCGLGLLLRFLRRYPKPAGEGPGASG
jgi:MFS family permease